MSVRFSALIVLALALCVPAFVRAEDIQQEAVETSKYSFEGSISTDAVFVRSGPSDRYYPTQKLDKGTKIFGVGVKFDWIKIVPPEGSFCYVPQAFVTRNADSNTGKVNRNDVAVRAGSVLSPLMTTVVGRLNKDDQVQITGSKDDYFKIAPPAGTYYYVNKEFVNFVKDTTGTKPMTTIQSTATLVAPTTRHTDDTPVAITKHPAPRLPSIDNPTGEEPAATAPDAPAPDTHPTVADNDHSTTRPTEAPVLSADEQLQALETEFTTISTKPLEEQPALELATKYQALAGLEGLSDTSKQVVKFRIVTLKARADSKDSLLEVRRIAKAAADKQMAMQAEQQELADRQKQTEVKIYTAVGTLQPSSLQVGNGPTLYRLTDPANGRTVVYLRTNQPGIADLIGKFVGVKGETSQDAQLPLKVVVSTALEAVDQTKVNGSVAAEIIPPSLLAKPASPTTAP